MLSSIENNEDDDESDFSDLLSVGSCDENITDWSNYEEEEESEIPEVFRHIKLLKAGGYGIKN